jgi:hypothetical protein
VEKTEDDSTDQLESDSQFYRERYSDEGCDPVDYDSYDAESGREGTWPSAEFHEITGMDDLAVRCISTNIAIQSFFNQGFIFIDLPRKRHV